MSSIISDIIQAKRQYPDLGHDVVSEALRRKGFEEDGFSLLGIEGVVGLTSSYMPDGYKVVFDVPSQEDSGWSCGRRFPPEKWEIAEGIRDKYQISLFCPSDEHFGFMAEDGKRHIADVAPVYFAIFVTGKTNDRFPYDDLFQDLKAFYVDAQPGA